MGIVMGFIAPKVDPEEHAASATTKIHAHYYVGFRPLPTRIEVVLLICPCGISRKPREPRFDE
jgi:hypothetical protein